ncbi:hypothetical protein Tco_0683840 [Tanacetum coccineum]
MPMTIVHHRVGPRHPRRVHEVKTRGLDKAISNGEIDLTKFLTKRRHDDKDEDPSTDAKKGKKKRRRKDSKPTKDKETAGSSKKGKAPSQPVSLAF